MTYSNVTRSKGEARKQGANRSGRVGLAVLLGGTFMAGLDAAIANVAAPEIQGHFGLTGTALVVALSGYTLAYAMLLITGARLGDDYGHSRLFLIGLAGFTAASLACGLAPSGTTLIFSRIVQGSACALMTPQVATIIQLRYEGSARARALGLFATVIALGVVAGQVLGGLMVTANILGLSWRPVFLINVPVGIVLLVAGQRSLALTRASERKPLDLAGVGMCAGSVLLILLPLLLGSESGWSLGLFVVMACGGGLAVVTGIYFRWLARRGGSPLIDPQIVADGAFALALGSLGASTIAWGGFLFTFTLYLQQGLGYGALHSGILFVPYGAGFAAASLGHGRLPGRFRPRLLYGGLIVASLAYATLSLIDRNGWHALASGFVLAIAGAGYGFGFSPMMAAAVGRVPAVRARDASGILTTAIQLSYAIGIAALGSLFLSRADVAGLHASGHAFMTTALVIAGLTLAAATLAASALTKSSGTAIAGTLAR